MTYRINHEEYRILNTKPKNRLLHGEIFFCGEDESRCTANFIDAFLQTHYPCEGIGQLGLTPEAAELYRRNASNSPLIDRAILVEAKLKKLLNLDNQSSLIRYLYVAHSDKPLTFMCEVIKDGLSQLKGGDAIVDIVKVEVGEYSVNLIKLEDELFYKIQIEHFDVMISPKQMVRLNEPVMVTFRLTKNHNQHGLELFEIETSSDLMMRLVQKEAFNYSEFEAFYLQSDNEELMVKYKAQREQRLTRCDNYIKRMWKSCDHYQKHLQSVIKKELMVMFVEVEKVLAWSKMGRDFKLAECSESESKDHMRLLVVELFHCVELVMNLALKAMPDDVLKRHIYQIIRNKNSTISEIKIRDLSESEDMFVSKVKEKCLEYIGKFPRLNSVARKYHEVQGVVVMLENMHLDSPSRVRVLESKLPEMKAVISDRSGVTKADKNSQRTKGFVPGVALTAGIGAAVLAVDSRVRRGSFQFFASNRQVLMTKLEEAIVDSQRVPMR